MGTTWEYMNPAALTRAPIEGQRHRRVALSRTAGKCAWKNSSHVVSAHMNGNQVPAGTDVIMGLNTVVNQDWASCLSVCNAS